MLDLILPNPDKIVSEIITFLRQTYAQANKSEAVVAVSGGIDSAVAVTLVTEALGPQHVWPIMLPYAEQSLSDSQAIIAVNRIPKSHWQTYNIQPAVDLLAGDLGISSEISDTVRLGNIMARIRMIAVFDAAKKHNALVCGTENKSEKYLAYFTRFGDEASDVEPIQDLYKTQIRQLAVHLNLPEQFVSKAPSAGLWQNQTDEAELGFSYQDADQVIAAYLAQTKGNISEITQFLAVTISQQTDVPLPVVEKVLQRIQSQDFKHQVPYVYVR